MRKKIAAGREDCSTIVLLKKEKISCAFQSERKVNKVHYPSEGYSMNLSFTKGGQRIHK